MKLFMTIFIIFFANSSFAKCYIIDKKFIRVVSNSVPKGNVIECPKDDNGKDVESMSDISFSLLGKPQYDADKRQARLDAEQAKKDAIDNSESAKKAKFNAIKAQCSAVQAGLLKQICEYITNQ